MVDFEMPTVALTPEQDVELTRALTSTSEEYGIDQYVNGLQILAHYITQ